MSVLVAASVTITPHFLDRLEEGDLLFLSLLWSVQKTSNLCDIFTQSVYTSNQLKSKVSEFQLYYSILAKILKIIMGFTMAKISKKLKS